MEVEFCTLFESEFCSRLDSEFGLLLCRVIGGMTLDTTDPSPASSPASVAFLVATRVCYNQGSCYVIYSKVCFTLCVSEAIAELSRSILMVLSKHYIKHTN